MIPLLVVLRITSHLPAHTVNDGGETIYNFEALRQRRSQEFDLSGYKWVKETKQPQKKLR